jgi:ankyrin repeat protein
LEAVEYDAVERGYYDMTMLILKHKSKPEGQRSIPDTTPLIACIRKCKGELFDLRLLKLLLDHTTTDVNEITSGGHTAIMEAVGPGCDEAEIIDLLLGHPDTKLDFRDKSGRTALHLAVESPQENSTAIVRLLHSAKHMPEVLDICDSSGMTAAMLLLRNQFMDPDEVVQILRSMSEAGADLSRIDNNGRGLLHAAAMGEQTSAVDYLHLEKNLSLDNSDSFGWCPLHYASGMRASQTVDRLLRLGASAELCDHRGWSPIDIVNCDDPEDHYVQALCALPSWSSLPNYSTAETFTRRRPAWSFANCDITEFRQQLHNPTNDFWLPDPKCGNHVCTTFFHDDAATDLDRFYTVLPKRTTYLSANCFWKTQISTFSTPRESQLYSSYLTSMKPTQTTANGENSTWRRSVF